MSDLVPRFGQDPWSRLPASKNVVDRRGEDIVHELARRRFQPPWLVPLGNPGPTPLGNQAGYSDIQAGSSGPVASQGAQHLMADTPNPNVGDAQFGTLLGRDPLRWAKMLLGRAGIAGGAVETARANANNRRGGPQHSLGGFRAPTLLPMMAAPPGMPPAPPVPQGPPDAPSAPNAPMDINAPGVPWWLKAAQSLGTSAPAPAEFPQPSPEPLAQAAAPVPTPQPRPPSAFDPSMIPGFNAHLPNMADPMQLPSPEGLQARTVLDPNTGGAMNDFYTEKLSDGVKKLLSRAFGQ